MCERVIRTERERERKRQRERERERERDRERLQAAKEVVLLRKQAREAWEVDG